MCYCLSPLGYQGRPLTLCQTCSKCVSSYDILGEIYVGSSKYFNRILLLSTQQC